MVFKKTHTSQSRGVLKEMGREIVETFTAFEVPVTIEEAFVGLRSYHFHLTPKNRVRMKVFQTFMDDLRFALGVDKIDIQAPLPSTKLIAITVPKEDESPKLDWQTAIDEFEFDPARPLRVPLGRTERNEAVDIDLTRMPHLLIGGTTSSGKSVLLNSILSSLLHYHTPETVRFILIDPKRVEQTMYNGIPHLLTEVITEPKQAVLALKWAVKEVERRYDLLEENKEHDIVSYQQRTDKKDSPMPYIVIAFDELSDVMASYPTETENAIIKISQQGRAVGIHLIIATQRPEVKVITNLMKTNIPSRVAMKVPSIVDSRTILDRPGAEKLQGKGDLLFQSVDMPTPELLQAYMIEEDTIEEQVKKLSAQKKDDASDTLNLTTNHDNSSLFSSFSDEDDDLYEEAKEAVIEAGKASTSFLQRKLRVGYSRAAALMDLLEHSGVIGPQEGSKPREVLQ